MRRRRARKQRENTKVHHRPTIQIRIRVNQFHVLWMDWLGWYSLDRTEIFRRHSLAMVGGGVAPYIRRAVLPLHDNRRWAVPRGPERCRWLRPVHTRPAYCSTSSS